MIDNKLFPKPVFVLLAMVVGLAVIGRVVAHFKTADLLANQDWSHFAGAEHSSNGLYVVPLNRIITHKDLSAGQANPPVNIRGPHLWVDGNFKLEAKLTNIDYSATLQFYGQVPVIYDEWRQEGPSIRITLAGNLFKAQIWDGSASNSVDERSYEVPTSKNATIIVARYGNEFIFTLNGNRLGAMPDHAIFDRQSVWVGADATPGGAGWTLKSLTATSLGRGKVEVVGPPALTTNINQPEALRNLGATHPRKLPIGAAVSLYPLLSDDRYREIALSQFSMITPENELKPQSIHPQKNTYVFTDADSLVEVAQNNQMLVHGHALIMPKANPLWMESTPEEARKQLMIDHIGVVVGHYKGKVAQWDVVNEPMSEEKVDYANGNNGLRPQMWFDAMGEGYIDLAFQAAHSADPQAKLFLNDFGLAEDNARWDAFLSLVKRLQTRGVPIHGVGFESHVYHKKDSIDLVILKRHIRQLAELGLESRISEIDVLGDDEQLQAEQYAGVLSVCLSELSCTSYGTWGITDFYGSTTLPDRYPPNFGDSLIWDADFQPKPAYSALQTVLKQK